MKELIWKFMLSLILGVIIVAPIVKYKYRNDAQDLLERYKNLSNLKKSELKYFVYYPLIGFLIPFILLLILLLKDGFSLLDGVVIGVYFMLMPLLIPWIQKEYWRRKSLLGNDTKGL